MDYSKLSDEEFRDVVERMNRGYNEEDAAAVTDTKPLSEDEYRAMLALAVMEGATFGVVGDEAMAAMAGLGSFLTGGKFNDAYNEHLKGARQRYDSFQQQYPGSYLGGQLAGGVGLGGAVGSVLKSLRTADTARKASTLEKGLGMLSAARPATIGAKVARGLKTAAKGAGAGMAGAGVAGYNMSPGDTTGAQTVLGLDPKRLNAAVQSAKFGGLFGAAVPAAASGGGAVINAGRKVLGIPKGSARERASQYVIEQMGRSKQRLERGGGPGARTVDDQLAAAERENKPLMLADVSDELQSAGSVAANLPGRGRQIATERLSPRTQAAPERVSSDLAQTVSPNKSLHGLQQSIIARRTARSKPLYDVAMKQGRVNDMRLAELASRPAIAKALKEAKTYAANMGDDISAEVAAGNGIHIKHLHYAKMSLDDQIDSAIRSGDQKRARALMQARNDLLKVIDDNNPHYAQARKEFAGHSDLMTASQEGRHALMRHPDEIAEELAMMSPGEREMYEAGFVQGLYDMMANMRGGDPVRTIFGSKMMRDRIRAVIGEKRFAALEKKMALEARMRKTSDMVYGGSQTAWRHEAVRDLEDFASNPDTAEYVINAAASGVSPVTALKQGFINWIARRYRGQTEEMRGHMADILFESDPETIRQIIKEDLIPSIHSALNEYKAKEARAILQGGVAGSSLTGKEK